MVVDGLTFCDVCREVIFPDDISTVKIPHEGHIHRFHFHNTNERPCLRNKLLELRSQFME